MSCLRGLSIILALAAAARDLPSLALQSAIDEGEFEAMTTLLRDGLDVNTAVELPKRPGETATPLIAAILAAAQGHEGGMAMVTTLLARENIDVNGAASVHGAQTWPLWVALEAAFAGKAGALVALELLMARSDTDLNVRMKTGEELLSPLFAAIMAGNEGALRVARNLAAHEGVDVNAGVTLPDGGSSTPLVMALPMAADGHAGMNEVVGTLLARPEVDVNAEGVMPDGQRMKALYIVLMASLGGKEEALKLAKGLLAKPSLDVNSILHDAEGNPMPSPLLLAARAVLKDQKNMGAKEIIWRLASRGAELADSDTGDEEEAQAVGNLVGGLMQAIQGQKAEAPHATQEQDDQQPVSKEEL